MLIGESGAGKCLAKDTPVLMFDGRIVPVQDVKHGDLLMGPDSKPRVALGITRSSGEMFKITPTKGDSFICNDVHVLTLFKRGRKESSSGLIDIQLDEFLKKDKTFRRNCYLVRTGVNFSGEWDLKISPYAVGVWIGDGTQRSAQVTKNDQEIADAWELEAKKYGIKFRTEVDSRNGVKLHIASVENGSGKNPIYQDLKNFICSSGKTIPLKYRTLKRKYGLELLAGIIDTDGCLTNGCYELVTKSKSLCDDYLFLIRSLGFSAYSSIKKVGERDYFRISISGDLSVIPCRIPRRKAPKRKQIKNVLHTGLSVESVGHDDYFGFTLDGDGRFLLGDFTITHNTCAALSLPGSIAIADFDNKAVSAAFYFQKKDPTVLDRVKHEAFSTGNKAEGYKQFQTWLKALETSEKKPDVVVLDSLTLYSECMMAYVMEFANPTERRSIRGIPALRDYQVSQMAFKSDIGRLLALDSHVICIAHSEQVMDQDTQSLKHRPLLSGKLVDYAPRIFHEVWWALKQKNKEGEIQHVAVCRSDKVITRTQITELPNIFPLDLSYAVQVMNKEQGALK